MIHLIHLYTGDGKGKTTAAVGLSVRAAGHQMKVLFTQFMKDGTSGELSVLRGISGIRVYPAPIMHKFTFQMTAEELALFAAQHTDFLERLRQEIDASKPDMIVLDELATAVSCGLIGREETVSLLQTAQASGETVITGHQPPDWLTEMCQYVSEIHAVRHPFADSQLPARQGIEW